MSRQILKELKNSDESKKIKELCTTMCGYQKSDLSNKFGFLDMCNKIVHSRTHTLKDDFIFEAEKDKTGVYVEIIAERKNKKDEHAVLVLLSFVECCTILSNINSKILIANK